MQTAADSKPLSNEIRMKMNQYREMLLNFEMLEPTKRVSSVWHWFFYKPVSDLTAFIVNLTGSDQSIEVVYGYASTAFTRFPGDENALIERGVSDQEITIREKIIIFNEADEADASRRILEMYHKYLCIEKKELLICAKEKRKLFIQQIAVKLKPLGFKKRGNTWTRVLTSDYYTMFNAQKSLYSDQYYFNVYIGKDGTDNYGDCYYTRVAPAGMFPVDWQALHKEDFDIFLDGMVIPIFEQIIHTPLEELGKIPSFWTGCHCNRQKCEHCWMEKNLWGTKENVVDK